MWGGRFKEAEGVGFVLDEGAGVGMGDEDSEADSFFGVFDGVVDGPIRTPRG